MNKGINLLKIKELRPDAPENKIERLRIFAFGLLFLVSIFSVVLFILIAFSPLPSLKNQENNARSTLAQFNGEIVKFLFINKRLDTINRILSKQKILSLLIQDINAKIPKGVDIMDIEINDKEAAITFSSPSLQAMDTLIDNLVGAVEEKKYFSQITLKNFSKGKDNSEYILNIHLIIL